MVGGEDFNDDQRGFDDLLLAVEFLQAVFAGDHYVRVEIALFLAQPEFDAFDEGAAGGAFEVGAEFGEEVAGNDVVADRGAGHGEDFAGDVFVAYGRLGFVGEVVAFAVGGVGGGFHSRPYPLVGSNDPIFAGLFGVVHGAVGTLEGAGLVVVGCGAG